MKLMLDFLKPFLVAMAILLAVSVGWYFFLYRPEASKSQVFKEQTEQLMIQLQSLRVTDVQISTLQTQIEKLNVELAKTNARVSPKDDLPKLIEQIKSRGAASGLKFITIIPDYNSLVSKADVETPEILKLTVHFQIQGYYKSFGNFIESLAALPFFVSVADFSLTYEETIFPQLLITADMVLYLRQTNETNEKTRWQS